MNFFKLSLLGLALTAFGAANASQPNCATSVNSNLVVGMDLTATGAGAPWESVNAEGTLVGFDVQIACQLASRLGYAGVTFLNIATDNLTAAINNGTINVAISSLEIATPLNPAQAFVKYNDSTSASSLGKGIQLSPTCCNLYVNIAAAISAMAADNTLANLRTEFNVTPNSYTPVSGIVPTACASTATTLPVRNALSTFMLTAYCLTPNCAPTAPTTVTTP